VGQLGFYDLDSRLKALSAKGDPLEALEALVPFESFRAEIEAVVRLAPNEVWADSAYRSVETEAKLKEKGYKSRIHRRGARNNPLCKRQQAANTTRSRVRARVEHVFADQENGMGGKLVRTIGMVRARVKIGLMNLVYNMRRLVQLERMAAASA
jgi:IS5 family transposase